MRIECFQPVEYKLPSLAGWINVPLSYRHTGVSGNLHDCKRTGTNFTEMRDAEIDASFFSPRRWLTWAASGTVRLAFLLLPVLTCGRSNRQVNPGDSSVTEETDSLFYLCDEG